jgi:hypothetical protein
MDASCFCCQFSLNTAGIIIGVYEIVQYTLLFFFALHFFKGNKHARRRIETSYSRGLRMPRANCFSLCFTYSSWYRYLCSLPDPDLHSAFSPSHLLAPCSFTDDSDFLTIVTCCLCSLIITSALLVYGSFKVSVLGFLFDCNSLTSFQRRRCRRWRQHFINSALFSHSALRCENVK